jgi:hypothetical protein
MNELREQTVLMKLKNAMNGISMMILRLNEDSSEALLLGYLL